MVKKIVALLLILIIAVPNVFAFYEEKNYIIVLDTPAVYSSDRPVFYSADADTEYRNALLELQSEFKAQINGTGISLFSIDEGYSYTELFNGFTMKMTEEKAEQVRNMSGVSAVIEDIIVPMATATLEDSETSSKLNSGNMIGADKMHEKGYDGSGKAIAIIDSELDINHTYFSAPENPKYTKQDIKDIIDSKNFMRNVSADNVYRSEKIPFAYNYAQKSDNVQPSGATIHGTHVTGIAAGSLKEVSDGLLSGVAPNSQVLFFGVFSNGGANIADIFAAMEDAVKLNADAINLSLGEEWLSENYRANLLYTLIRQTIQNAKNAGIAVVYAAGNFNNGNPENTDYIDYSTADNSTFPYAIKAGAVNTEYVPSEGQIVQGSLNPTIYELSSYGYSDSLDISVDFSAPGGKVYSSYPSVPTSTAENAHERFEFMSGTSMAAPQISGSMLLMNQYVEQNFPSYTGANKVTLVRNLLASTAKNIYDENDVLISTRVAGSGLIDLEKATETKVYLTAENSDFSRITLGEIEDTFNIKFTAHNLSQTDITFDNITTEFSTDDYTEINSVYKFSGLTKLNPSVSGDSSVTIPANGSADITLSVTLDDTEINYLSTGFKNGFFIDGKVTLSGDENVSVGIPLTGFYGGWDSQPVADVYTIAPSLGVKAYATKEGSTYIMYKSKSASALSTQACIHFVRNCEEVSAQTRTFINKNDYKVCPSIGNYSTLSFALPNREVSQSFNISVREDSQPPSITISEETQHEGEMYTPLNFSDSQSAVSAFILSYDGLDKPLLVPVTPSSKGINIETSHKNATITVFDGAFNSTTLKIGVEISVADDICTITNNTGKDYLGSCILGVYENDKLSDLKILADNVSLDIMETETIGNLSTYQNKHYKIFFWDNYSPVCEIYENKI